MKKITFQYNRWGKVVTGGQKYENMLFEMLSHKVNLTVERKSIGIGFSLKEKLLAPICNLKQVIILKSSDLIIFNSVGAPYFILLSIFLRILNKKTIVIHHHFMHLEFSGIKKLFYKTIEILFLKSCYRVVTPSPYIYDECLKIFPKRKIILWSIPFKEYEKIENNPKRGNLLYIGTVEPRKGLHHLINSLAVLKKDGCEFSLTIIGKIVNEDYYKKLNSVIKDNNIKVIFTGFVDSAKKEKILLESDFFVFPSLLEGFGMVLCEVMRYGLPVISFDNSAMPYSVKHNYNGLLVDNKDENKFAEAIKLLLNNRQLRNLLSAGAIESSKHFITLNQFKKIVETDIQNILVE